MTGESLIDAVTNGANDRLRAVLMTGLLASLGLLPAALSHAIGSDTQGPVVLVSVDNLGVGESIVEDVATRL